MLCWYLFLLRQSAVTSTIHCHSMEAFTTRRLIGTSTKKKLVTALSRNKNKKRDISYNSLIIVIHSSSLVNTLCPFPCSSIYISALYYHVIFWSLRLRLYKLQCYSYSIPVLQFIIISTSWLYCQLYSYIDIIDRN